jgi:aldehyde:ferredoxin oxidoreductase
MFLTGPLTGLVPGGAHTCLAFKSPLTGLTLGHAITGAQWGPELRAAGYEGLIIAGQAAEPVYLYIEDDRVEIRDAAPLWSLGTMATEIRLKEGAGNSRVRVLCIGPGGENKVRFASVQQEYFRSAARGGSGCLMGSKRLKAVVVRGGQAIPVARPQELSQAHEAIRARLTEARTQDRRGYSLARWGSTVSQTAHSDISELDVRNYREAWWDQVDAIGGLEYERRCKVRSRSCFGCPIACMQTGVIREGPYAGTLTNPDFDSSGTIGPGCLVTDFEGATYLSSLGDDLGLDNAYLGNVTSFAMECYEKGLLGKADLDGIDLTWGNVEAIIALWDKIVRREGIGDLLAQGVHVAAQEIGHGAEAFAMHVKGLSFAGYAPQAHPDRALQYAVADRGGCHHYGLTIAEQNLRALADSILVCSWHRSLVPASLYRAALNAVTGWNMSEADWEETGRRILILARAYNIREGMVPLRDDVLPARVHRDALTWGPRAGAVYPREQFERDRAVWYQGRGCDEQGVPTKARLQELGLEFAVSALEVEGAWSQSGCAS